MAGFGQNSQRFFEETLKNFEKYFYEK